MTTAIAMSREGSVGPRRSGAGGLPCAWCVAVAVCVVPSLAVGAAYGAAQAASSARKSAGAGNASGRQRRAEGDRAAINMVLPSSPLDSLPHDAVDHLVVARSVGLVVGIGGLRVEGAQRGKYDARAPARARHNLQEQRRVRGVRQVHRGREGIAGARDVADLRAADGAEILQASELARVEVVA